MTTPPPKPPAKGTPDRPKSNDRKPGEPEAVVLTPVLKKIGEPPGNLKARSEAFKRRHGTSK